MADAATITATIGGGVAAAIVAGLAIGFKEVTAQSVRELYSNLRRTFRKRRRSANNVIAEDQSAPDQQGAPGEADPGVPTFYADGSDLPIDDIPCPRRGCGSRKFKVKSRQAGLVILVCDKCGGILRASFKDRDLVKLVMAGVITLEGTHEIAHHFLIDHDDLAHLALEILGGFMS